MDKDTRKEENEPLNPLHHQHHHHEHHHEAQELLLEKEPTPQPAKDKEISDEESGETSSSNSVDSDEIDGYTLQGAYRKIGGMGRFHIFSSAMLIIGFMSGSFLG